MALVRPPPPKLNVNFQNLTKGSLLVLTDGPVDADSERCYNLTLYNRDKKQPPRQFKEIPYKKLAELVEKYESLAAMNVEISKESKYHPQNTGFSTLCFDFDAKEAVENKSFMTTSEWLINLVVVALMGTNGNTAFDVTGDARINNLLEVGDGEQMCFEVMSASHTCGQKGCHKNGASTHVTLSCKVPNAAQVYIRSAVYTSFEANKPTFLKSMELDMQAVKHRIIGSVENGHKSRYTPDRHYLIILQGKTWTLAKTQKYHEVQFTGKSMALSFLPFHPSVRQKHRPKQIPMKAIKIVHPQNSQRNTKRDNGNRLSFPDMLRVLPNTKGVSQEATATKIIIPPSGGGPKVHPSAVRQMVAPGNVISRKGVFCLSLPFYTANAPLLGLACSKSPHEKDFNVPMISATREQDGVKFLIFCRHCQQNGHENYCSTFKVVPKESRRQPDETLEGAQPPSQDADTDIFSFIRSSNERASVEFKKAVLVREESSQAQRVIDAVDLSALPKTGARYPKERNKKWPLEQSTQHCRAVPTKPVSFLSNSQDTGSFSKNTTHQLRRVVKGRSNAPPSPQVALSSQPNTSGIHSAKRQKINEQITPQSTKSPTPTAPRHIEAERLEDQAERAFEDYIR